jgi:hypothetical protein
MGIEGIDEEQILLFADWGFLRYRYNLDVYIPILFNLITIFIYRMVHNQ